MRIFLGKKIHCNVLEFPAKGELVLVGAFIPCCWDLSAADHSSHFSWLQRVAVSLGRGNILRELLKLFLDKPCLAELITSCQEMSMSCPSALALLKLFVKCQTPGSSPGLQSHRTAWEVARLSKLIYLCVICREVLWLGWSLILWQAGKSLFKFKKPPPPLQALLSVIASMLTRSFTGPALALFYYPCVVCQYVYSLSCKGGEISLSDDYSKHKILLGFLKKYFFKC